MSEEPAGPRLDPRRLARDLGNWRTASTGGPTYVGLADGLRLLVVDGRVPVGTRLPSERALADALRVSRTTVTAAYGRLRDDGFLRGRRGALGTAALPVGDDHRPEPATPAARTGLGGPAGRAGQSGARTTANLAAAALSAPAAITAAYAQAATMVGPHLGDIGVDLTGVPELRTALARRYTARGLGTEPDEIMVTSGALHAFQLLLATFTQPGDRVLVEQPTYHGALSALVQHGLRPVPVPVTADGWDVEAIESATVQSRPTLAYLIPDNHNPTGMTLSGPDRTELARVIARTRLRTVVDESITDMWLDGVAQAPFAATATARPELVISVGSTSKSFWGGLRVGWIRADRAVLAAVAAVRPAIDMGTAIFEQLTATALLGVEDEILPERRSLLHRRRAVLLDLLASRLPDWEPLPGTGGMSLWVRLPAPMSSALSASASRLGLEIPPGPRFGVDGTLERFIRVPYSQPEDRLAEAVDLLADAWRSVTGAEHHPRRALVV